jgi:hypothetical protein
MASPGVSGRQGTAPPPGTPAPSTAAQLKLEEEAVKTRRRAGNGIAVDEPKVYDDSLLQAMLQAAQARLAAIQAIDQAGITSRIGAVTGASQRISSVGINVQTPSIPGVVTTDKGATAGTVDKLTTTVSAENKTSTVNEATRSSGAATQDVATTAPAFGPPSVTAPAASTTLPSSFSVSASDALNEQMQLTYEIANLRLLLEGAVSDHGLITKTGAYVKPRSTLGFPIAIDARKDYKDAVAIVEVEVETPSELSLADKDAPVKPSITALLPREKTYNVAAITDSTMSIGGGVATSIVGVSGSWVTGHKTYYITQDQDTVALTYPPADSTRVGFMWQFRPVLGQKSVRSGLRQTFVQLAFPSPQSACRFGTVTVRTYWVEYNTKRNTVGDVIKDSLQTFTRSLDRGIIVNQPFSFSSADIEDIGGGNLLVSLPGRFLPGTYIRIGNTFLRAGDPGVTLEHFRLRFAASASDLARKEIAIVTRDGQETPLDLEEKTYVRPCSGSPAQPTTATPAAGPLTGLTATVVDLDDGNARLTIDGMPDANKSPVKPYLLLVGNKVFGYSDAPIKRDGTKLVATVPMALLVANQTVTVKQLFLRAESHVAVPGLTELSRTERLVPLGQTKYLLYGNRLGNLKVLEPGDADLSAIGRAEDAATLRVLTLKPEHLKNFKQIVLQRTGERPFLLPMPAATPEKAPTAKARERAIVGVDEATFDIEGTELKTVTVMGKSVAFEVHKDGKSVRVTGLKAAGVTATATSQVFEFEFKNGKAAATLDIVTSRTEVIVRTDGKG